MRITIESTAQKIMTDDGTECWLWRGRTTSGLECEVAVASIGCLPRDAEAFEREVAADGHSMYDGPMFGAKPPKPI